MSHAMILMERSLDVGIGLQARSSSAGGEFFSLMPEVSLALDQAGQTYRILEEFTPAEEFNRMALERYSWLDGFLSELDARIHEALPFFKEGGVRPAASHFFYFKILFDGLAATAHLQTNAMRSLRPPRILYVPSKAGKFGRELFFVGDSIHSHLAPLSAAASGLEAVPMAPPADFSFQARGSRLWRMVRFCPRQPLTRMFGEKIREFISHKETPAFSEERPQVIILQNTHDVPLLMERLRLSKGWEAVVVGADGRAPGFTPSLEDKALADQMISDVDRLWESLETDAAWRAKMVFHGVNVFSVVRSRLEWFIRKGLPEASVLSAYWGRIFQKRPPVCILGSSSNVGYAARVPSSAGRHVGVPMVLFQEGAGFGVPDCPIYNHTDVRNCDLFLGYGVGTDEYVSSLGVTTRCRAVGSARLEALRANVGFQKKAVNSFLYVPTGLQRRVQHHPYNGGSAPYYFEFQKRLLSVFSSVPELRFIVKLSPSDPDRTLSHWLAWQRERLPNCRVAEGPLRLFLPEAAGFILDFPSTTFLEALMTDKPIFICLDSHLTRLDPGVETLIARRAVVCHGIEDLAVQLQLFSKGNPRSADFSETSVRRRFATHLDDGASLERAVQALEAVVGEGR